MHGLCLIFLYFLLYLVLVKISYIDSVVYCISRSESINILVLPHFIAVAVYAVKQTFSQDKRLKIRILDHA